MGRRWYVHHTGHDIGNTPVAGGRQISPDGHKVGMYHEVSVSKPVPVWLLLPILVVIMAAVIGDPGGRSPSPAVAAGATEPRLQGRCVPVSHAFVSHLVSRTATGTAPRVDISRASAYVGTASSYFVAAEFNTADGIIRTGVWVSRSLESGERWIYSADGFARGMTTWPDASSRGPLMQPSDPRINFARQCLATGEFRTR
jgi:hypothetical protein